MIRVMKTAMIVVGLILIVITLGGIVSYVQAGSVAEGAVKESLDEAFGTPVSWGEVSVDFGDRAIVINDLEIMNPKGFDEASAIRCKEMRIQVEPASLLSSTPRITNLKLTQLDVNMQHALGSGLNLGSWFSKSDDEEEPTEDTEASEKTEEPDWGIIVDTIEYDRATVTAKSSLLPSQSAVLEVAPFTVSEEETGDRVRTPAELRSFILGELMSEALTKDAPRALGKMIEDIFQDE